MRILLVEDIDADAILLREALIDAGLGKDLTVAGDAEQALEILRASGPLPQLVLLDLNLPRVSGHRLLEDIRADDRLAALPILVLSTSNSPADIAFAYAHKANAYVRKPNGYEALSAVACAIRDFWTQTATLPSAYVA